MACPDAAEASHRPLAAPGEEGPPVLRAEFLFAGGKAFGLLKPRVGLRVSRPDSRLGRTGLPRQPAGAAFGQSASSVRRSVGGAAGSASKVRSNTCVKVWEPTRSLITSVEQRVP